MLNGVLRIPARTGFHLAMPACDMRLTAQNSAASLTKLPHIVLFGLFFLLTVTQFNHVDWRAAGWSFLATIGMGFLIELEEGATRTGNCRISGVVPDALGALIAVAAVMAVVMIHRRWAARSEPVPN